MGGARVASIFVLALVLILLAVVVRKGMDLGRPSGVANQMVGSTTEADVVRTASIALERGSEPHERFALVAAGALSFAVIRGDRSPFGPGSEIWGWLGCPIGSEPRHLADVGEGGRAEVADSAAAEGVWIAGVLESGKWFAPMDPLVDPNSPDVMVEELDARALFLVDGDCKVELADSLRLTSVEGPKAHPVGFVAPAIEVANMGHQGEPLSSFVIGLPRELDARARRERVRIHVAVADRLSQVIEIPENWPWLYPVQVAPAGTLELIPDPNCGERDGWPGDGWMTVRGQPSSGGAPWTLSTSITENLRIGSIEPGSYELTVTLVDSMSSGGRQAVTRARPIEIAVLPEVLTTAQVCMLASAESSPWGRIEFRFDGLPADLPRDALLIDRDSNEVLGIYASVMACDSEVLPGLSTNSVSRTSLLGFDGARTFAGGIGELIEGRYQVRIEGLDLVGEVLVEGAQSVQVGGSLARRAQIALRLVDSQSGAAVGGLVGVGQPVPGCEPASDMAFGAVEDVGPSGVEMELLEGAAQAYVAADGYLSRLVDFSVEPGVGTVALDMHAMPVARLQIEGPGITKSHVDATLRSEFTAGEWRGLENPSELIELQRSGETTTMLVRFTFEGSTEITVTSPDGRGWSASVDAKSGEPASSSFVAVEPD
ncbi:hypothetical protein [Planctomycetes bacterium Pla133]